MPRTSQKKNKKIEGVLGEDLFNQVTFFANKLGVSQSEFVRQALIYYISHLKKEVVNE